MVLALERATENPTWGGWTLCSRTSKMEVFIAESHDGAGSGLISADGISGCEERERGGGEEHGRRIRYPAKVVLTSES